MTFNESNSIGKYAESLVIRRLRNSGWLLRDCSSDKKYQALGIDLLAKKNHLRMSIDVKCDTYASDNFVMEFISNDNKGSEGCILSSQADYWFYYFKSLDTMYYFNPAQAVEAMGLSGEPDFRVIKHPTKGYDDNILYYSHSYLVPIVTLAKAIPVGRIKNYSQFG